MSMRNIKKYSSSTQEGSTFACIAKIKSMTRKNLKTLKRTTSFMKKSKRSIRFNTNRNRYQQTPASLQNSTSTILKSQNCVNITGKTSIDILRASLHTRSTPHKLSIKCDELLLGNVSTVI